MDRARLLLLGLILVGITSCASLIVNSSDEGPEDLRWDMERCPVHGDLLVDDVVRMRSTHPQTHPWIWDVRRKLFPCCLEDTDDSRNAAYLVKCCPHCRLARELYAESATSFDILHLPDPDEFIAEQRRELQERHPETQFVDEIPPAESNAALETEPPAWVE